MKSYLLAFVIAATVAALLTPLVRVFALRINAVASPGGRHVHGRNIPRLGGVGIFAGFFAPLVVLAFTESGVARIFRDDFVHAVGLFAGGLLMAATGFVDDTRRLGAKQKLLVQVIAGCIAFATGFRIEAVKLPFLGDLHMGVFALPVTIAWIVGIVNAINLVDGLDGLAAGVAFFAGLTNFCVAYVTSAVFPALVMAAMLGAVLGFLFYNFNPARIFMGDSGSYFLGFVLATSGLLGSVQKSSTTISLLVPVLALGVPIFDTLFSIVRRFLERRPIFSPDRGHLHHKLLDMGLTHRRAVLILYGVSVVFTVAALAVALDRSWYAGLAMVGASVALVGLVRFVGYFEYLHRVGRQKARFRSRDAELLRYVLPEVPALFEGAADEAELWRALQIVQERADIGCVELVVVKGKREETAHAWVADELPNPLSPDLVSARYPLGREEHARCALRFRWLSDRGDVSPQTEVLLQVVVDVLAKNLVRVESVHAPEVPEAHAVAPPHLVDAAHMPLLGVGPSAE